MLRHARLSFVLAPLMLASVAAQQLVVDLNTAPGTGTMSSRAREFVDLGAFALFVVDDPASGVALWRTDGTAQGTSRVHIFQNARNLVRVGNGIFFTASDAVVGEELWVSDGTSVTLVADIRPGILTSAPSGLTAVGNRVFFTANNGTVGRELFVSDGTAAGTTLVADLAPGAFGSDPREFAAAGGLAYFVATNPTLPGLSVWRSDGTVAGTVKLVDFLNGSSAGQITPFGASVLFRGGDGIDIELWQSDGTAAGTGRVLDIEPGTSGSYPADFTVLGSEVLFSADDSVAGRELWRTNGTAAGTSRLVDMNPGLADGFDGGPQPGTPTHFVSLGSRVFFTASDGVNGFELWSSDGTAAGTALWFDTLPGPVGGYPWDLTRVGNALFWSAVPTAWVLGYTDGTLANTPLLQLPQGPLPANPTQLRPFGDHLLLQVRDPVFGVEPWISDGTQAGTQMLVDVFPDAASASPAGLQLYGDRVLFAAFASSGQGGLWASDGTAAGTVAVTPAQFLDRPRDVVQFGGRIAFGAGEAMLGDELYISDGTPAGTFAIDIRPGTNGSRPRGFAALGNLVVFAADAGAGFEPYVSDGTAAGTIPLQDIVPGGVGSDPQGFVAVGNRVFFVANGVTVTGRELWATDGTIAGTAIVRDILPGAGDGVTGVPIAFAGKAWFAANDGVSGFELWASDGTSVGTTLVRDIHSAGGSTPMQFAVHGDRLWFSADDGIAGREPWSTDGTAGNTQRVTDVRSGPLSSSPAAFRGAGGHVFFFADDGVHGVEPWSSDGIGANLLVDGNPGSGNSQLALAPSDGISQIGNGPFVGMSLFRPGIGAEPWISDGTPAGTMLLDDLYPGPASSGASRFLAVRDQLFFAADAGQTGFELFVVTAAEAGASYFEHYGAPCVGVGSPLPAVDPIGAPVLTNTTFGLRATDLAPTAPCLFYFALAAAATPVGPCQLLVDDIALSLLALTDPTGEASLSLRLTNSMLPVGFEMFSQVVWLDPQGPYLGLAATDGLRMVLGR